MKNDLLILYKDIILKSKTSPEGYDILLDEDITPFKIKYFFDRLFETKILFELFSNDGDVNVVYEDKPIKGGFEFKYENEVNDINFYTIINLFNNEHYSNKLDYDIMDFLMTKNNPEQLQQVKNILDNNKNKYIMGFRFEDEQQLTSITGKIKNKSAAVFGAVYRNIRNVIFKKNYFNKIIMYYCLVSKTEIKRVELYKEIMKRTLKAKNYILDDVSNNEYAFLYFW